MCLEVNQSTGEIYSKGMLDYESPCGTVLQSVVRCSVGGVVGDLSNVTVTILPVNEHEPKLHIFGSDKNNFVSSFQVVEGPEINTYLEAKELAPAGSLLFSMNITDEDLSPQQQLTTRWRCDDNPSLLDFTESTIESPSILVNASLLRRPRWHAASSNTIRCNFSASDHGGRRSKTLQVVVTVLDMNDHALYVP